MPYISIENGIISRLSDRYYKDSIYVNSGCLGQRTYNGRDMKKVALICNWDQKCGISTYSKYLYDVLNLDVKIFSEYPVGIWKRGESMVSAIKEVLAWEPDVVLIQHEFGIFPKATHFLKMIDMLQNIPYVITLHSVYEHLDKSICTSVIKNIIVHTEEAKEMLLKLGNKNNVYVVPHGCIPPNDDKNLWNIFQTPHTLFQFGFGFNYKGVDRAIEAISLLKPDFPDIFYCYLCSENEKTKSIQDKYVDYLNKKIKEFDIEDNVSIIRGFHTEEAISRWLKTVKLAIFPYLTDPNNMVYGSSGAIKIAMAHGIPVIASESHLFDDIKEVVSRPSNASELAIEIKRTFSDENYRKNLKCKMRDFILENSWEKVGQRYQEVLNTIYDDFYKNSIVV